MSTPSPATNRMREAATHARTLCTFIGREQLSVIADACRGEERDFFFDKLREYAERVTAMPKVYEQDGKSDQAVVYLHYFLGDMDFYITERDISEEQLQAFGYSDLGYGPELGYVSIEEITSNGVELDLHWRPRPWAEVNRKREAA